MDSVTNNIFRITTFRFIDRIKGLIQSLLRVNEVLHNLQYDNLTIHKLNDDGPLSKLSINNDSLMD
jgi:hypothetical protein